jgi:hypothetical protein
MPSVILAGTTTGTALSLTSDTSGELQIRTNNGSTTAMTLTTGGNINIPTTGARITGDFSNATIANRVGFQSSTTNGNTDIQVIPNGTSVISGIRLNNNSDLTNASYGRISLDGSTVTIASDRNSVSGTYLPLLFNTGGSERLRIDTSGNVGIGTSSPSTYGIFAVQTQSGSTPTIAITADGLSPKLNHFIIDSTSVLRNLNQIQFVTGSSDISNYQGYMTFSTMGSAGGTISERMRIDASGNVGIGNTPQGNWKLQVTGGSLIANSSGSATSYAGVRLNSQVLPTSDNGTTSTFSHCIGGNYSNGGAEMDFFNCVNSGVGFHFYQKTGAASVTKVMDISNNGNLIISGGTATKATGTTWANPSDIRLKDNIENYTKGLLELMQVNVKTWEYNGKGGTVQGTKGLGVIADEIKEVLPDTVDDYKAKLNDDDAEDSNIKKFDATEITWLLVNAVKEQQALITQLQADVAALKGAK